GVARLCVRKRVRDQVQDSEALAGLCGGVMGELAPLIESVRVVEEGQLTAKSAGLGGLAATFRLEYPNGTREVAERPRSARPRRRRRVLTHQVQSVEEHSDLAGQGCRISHARLQEVLCPFGVPR